MLPAQPPRRTEGQQRITSGFPPHPLCHKCSSIQTELPLILGSTSHPGREGDAVEEPGALEPETGTSPGTMARAVMQAAAMEGQPLALSLAEKAVCKVVYGAPRPRPLLLPVGLELWLYVQKMRNLQRKRWGPGRRQASRLGA